MWYSAIGCLVTLTLSLLAAPLLAVAQPAGQMRRIGMLRAGMTSTDSERNFEAFRQGLRDLGWVEGQNLTIEYRAAEGQVERLSALVAELLQLQVEVLVTAGGLSATFAAKAATSTLPIVMVTIADPVRAGLVDSLARPGENVTGVAGLGSELIARRLELLKEAVPHPSRIAVLRHLTGNPADIPRDVREAQVVAQTLGVELHVQGVRSPAEFEGAFAAMTKAGADALLVFTDPLLLEPHGSDITALALKHRLPAIYPWRMYADAGGLMAYGISLRERFRRAAAYVDKLLKGAKPDDLPVEQPMQFEFVINVKTAQAMGLTLPPILLFQADEVIQ
jgi:putative ABC transport system substrate-binding protein